MNAGTWKSQVKNKRMTDAKSKLLALIVVNEASLLLSDSGRLFLSDSVLQEVQDSDSAESETLEGQASLVEAVWNGLEVL